MEGKPEHGGGRRARQIAMRLRDILSRFGVALNVDDPHALETGVARLDALTQPEQLAPLPYAAMNLPFARACRVYATLVHHAPNAIVLVDTTHRCVLANNAYMTLHGIPAEQIVGNTLRAIIGDEHYRIVAEQLARVFTGETIEFTTWFTYPDGNRFMHVYYYPIRLDDVIAYAGVILTDITPQARTEEALRDSEERFYAFSEASTEGIVIHENGIILEANQAIADHLGYAQHELHGMPVLELTAPESRPEMIQRMRAGDPGPYLAISLHRDGTRTIGEIRARNFVYHGRPVRLVAMRDITALMRAQDEREIYIHTVSHDLRAPLTVINGHAQLIQHQLSEDGLDGDLAVSVDAILHGVQRMNTMIQDLVDAARLEGGQLQLSMRPLDLPAFLRELLARSESIIPAARLQLDLPAQLPFVSADADRLERIFMNLLSNALKYSPKEAPVIIRARKVDAMVDVAVQDFGVGIEPEELPHLFDRFYRARETHGVEGIGLGLYITSRLVEAHGGSLRVSSVPDAGSTFTFSLPVA